MTAAIEKSSLRKLSIISFAILALFAVYLLLDRLSCFSQKFDDARIAEVLFELNGFGYASSSALRASGMQVVRSSTNAPWGHSATVLVFVKEEGHPEGGVVERLFLEFQPCGQIKKMETSTQGHMTIDDGGNFVVR